MPTRKYYKMIAKVINNNRVELVDETTQDGNSKWYINEESFINDLSIEFKADNNLFNSDTFKSACNE